MFKDTWREWVRVLKLSRKPRKSEFFMIAKITGIGIFLVGTIGFIIRMILQVTGITL
ncbi:MAG: protein translocase SEC61 complex subunit gamma [Candidatus Hydrothermarchaeaceae archaeon]